MPMYSLYIKNISHININTTSLDLALIVNLIKSVNTIISSLPLSSSNVLQISCLMKFCKDVFFKFRKSIWGYPYSSQSIGTSL